MTVTWCVFPDLDLGLQDPGLIHIIVLNIGILWKEKNDHKKGMNEKYLLIGFKMEYFKVAPSDILL